MKHLQNYESLITFAEYYFVKEECYVDEELCEVGTIISVKYNYISHELWDNSANNVIRVFHRHVFGKTLNVGV